MTAGNREVPRFAIGHVSLDVLDVQRSLAFYERIGMRSVVDMGSMGIIELRGGTHIILRKADHASGTLDLIVDDIDETYALLAEAGARPGDISRGFPHDRFVATDSEGNRLVVNSTHAIGEI